MQGYTRTRWNHDLAGMSHESERDREHETGVTVETSRPDLERPAMYQVVLLNDDYTPMEFVVDVLRNFFSLNQERAVQIMLQVHHRGKGVCGIFTREVAETKVNHVNEYSLANQHPLMCTMEKL